MRHWLRRNPAVDTTDIECTQSLTGRWLKPELLFGLLLSLERVSRLTSTRAPRWASRGLFGTFRPYVDRTPRPYVQCRDQQLNDKIKCKTPGRRYWYMHLKRSLTKSRMCRAAYQGSDRFCLKGGSTCHDTETPRPRQPLRIDGVMASVGGRIGLKGFPHNRLAIMM